MLPYVPPGLKRNDAQSGPSPPGFDRMAGREREDFAQQCCPKGYTLGETLVLSNLSIFLPGCPEGLCAELPSVHHTLRVLGGLSAPHTLTILSLEPRASSPRTVTQSPLLPVLHQVRDGAGYTQECTGCT